ncbi:hypothetical protein ACEPAI_4011 [Sanghuangporus weigelae]
MPEYGESPESTSSAAMHPGADDPESELQRKIHLLFERSVSSVQDYSSKIHQMYLSPALTQARAFSETHPVLSLFIGIYSILSFVPIAAFFFSTVFILFASITVALAAATILSGFIISLSAFFLFCTLFWVSLVSISVTALVLLVYQLKRLVINLREESAWQTGIKKWVFELQEFALSRLPKKSHADNSHIQEPPRVAQPEDTPAKIEAVENNLF